MFKFLKNYPHAALTFCCPRSFRSDDATTGDDAAMAVVGADAATVTVSLPVEPRRSARVRAIAEAIAEADDGDDDDPTPPLVAPGHELDVEAGEGGDCDAVMEDVAAVAPGANAAPRESGVVVALFLWCRCTHLVIPGVVQIAGGGVRRRSSGGGRDAPGRTSTV